MLEKKFLYLVNPQSKKFTYFGEIEVSDVYQTLSEECWKRKEQLKAGNWLFLASIKSDNIAARTEEGELFWHTTDSNSFCPEYRASFSGEDEGDVSLYESDWTDLFFIDCAEHDERVMFHEIVNMGA